MICEGGLDQEEPGMIIIIIESVDSINRDDPDTPIYVIHYKNLKCLRAGSLV